MARPGLASSQAPYTLRTRVSSPKRKVTHVVAENVTHPSLYIHTMCVHARALLPVASRKPYVCADGWQRLGLWVCECQCSLERIIVLGESRPGVVETGPAGCLFARGQALLFGTVDCSNVLYVSLSAISSLLCANKIIVDASSIRSLAPQKQSVYFHFYNIAFKSGLLVHLFL